MNDRYKEDLEWFVKQMVIKLDENNHKGTWKEDSILSLFQNLCDELDELDIEVDSVCGLNSNESAYPRIIKECADVANVAMMIAERAKEGMK